MEEFDAEAAATTAQKMRKCAGVLITSAVLLIVQSYLVCLIVEKNMNFATPREDVIWKMFKEYASEKMRIQY